MNEIYDVAIVGYGPVGQLLALSLARKGLRIAAVERYPTISTMPRAVHYDDEVGRIFQSAGVGDEIRAVSAPMPPSFFDYVDAQGEVLMRRTFGGMGLSGWPMSNGFAQGEIEQVLDAAVRRSDGVTLFMGHTCTAVTQSDETAQLSIVSSEGAESKIVARYVVGADGSNSFVRRTMGFTETDLGFAYDWLVVNVLYANDDVERPGMVQICDPARAITITPAGRGRQRWEFMLTPGETAESMNRADVTWDLLKKWNIGPNNASLERHAVYTFNARWADTWRKGRVLLAGDAAHVMPPFAGQGMCSGMRDVASLAWRLPMVLSGEAGPELLDSYGDERLQHVKTWIFISVEVGKVICVTDPVLAAERDAMLKQTPPEAADAVRPPAPRLGPGVLRDGDPHAGQLILQARVEHEGRVGLFDDVMGGGFALIGTTIDPAAHLSAENRAFLDRLGALVVQVAKDGPVKDVDGAYADYFAAQGVGAILARPDFYQFAATDDPAQLNTIVDDLREKLRWR